MDANNPDHIGQAIERDLTALVEAGNHPDLVLGVAMARVIGIIADRYGPEIAAAAATSAAQKCQALPPHPNDTLARVQPMGQA